MHNIAISNLCINVFRYSTITSDVLTSIKKTEDSLLRLKRTRKQTGAATSALANTLDNQGTLSDDDKIRLQFALDVQEFRNRVSVQYLHHAPQ